MIAATGRLAWRGLRAAAWIALAAVLAFGTAGIVSGVNHLPGTPGRADLTYAADLEIAPSLASVAGELRTISSDVERLSDLGRSALTALIAGDVERLSTTIVEGSRLAESIERASDGLRARLAALPGTGEGMDARFGAAVVVWYRTLVAALEATANLEEDWTTLASGSVPAIRLTAALAGHDRIAAEGASLGTKAKYPQAIARIQEASKELDAARTIRDELAKSVDVSTLDEWIERNANLDAALIRLYRAVAAAKGRSTPELKAALLAERAAQAKLPPDTRGLVIILGEIAQGGLSQAVISIEQARGRIEDALASPTPIVSPVPGVSPAPVPSAVASTRPGASGAAGASPGASRAPRSASPGPTR